MKEKKKFNKLKIIIPIGIVIFIILAIVFGNKSQKVDSNYVKTEEIILEDIKSFVNSSGVVLSKDSYDVSSKVTGEVISVLVNEGDSVKKGDVLAELNKFSINSQIADTEIQLAIAKENLVQILNQGSNNYKSSYKNALLTKDTAYKAYLDGKKLFEAGVYSKLEYDNLYNSYSQAKNNYDEIRGKYTGATSASEIKIQELRIEAMENTLLNQNEQLIETTIVSPINGVVTGIHVKELNYASAGNPVFTVENLDSLKIEANVSQYDIHKIKLGQTVVIIAEGMSDVEFEGIVSHIGSRAISKVLKQSQEMVIEVEVDITTKETNLKPNFSARIEIETGAAENVLLLPFEAIYITKEGDSVVYTIDGGVAKKHVIEKGIEGVFKFEVISETLKAEDKIILNPTEKIEDGSKVIEMGGE